MAIRARQTTWSSVLLIMLAGGLWALDQWNKAHPKSGDQSSKDTSSSVAPGKPPTPGTAGAKETKGSYEVYRGCTLVTEKHNDGDSFEVRLQDGRTEIFRLYFVDTPESDFKEYGRGENNYKRIGEQAAALGGITPEQAVQIGHQAKEFTLPLLAKQPFTLYTKWDSPFNDQRYHAFIEVTSDGKPRWLDELLVERGFCRIFTKGADLPDGTLMFRRKHQLYAIELEAKARRAGAWGLR